MPNFNYSTEVNENISRIKTKEEILSMGLNIPYNYTNAGPRKIMDITHQSHALVLNNSEVPYIFTGYENLFGDRSSSVLSLDRDYIVAGVISKFEYTPHTHYYMILEDPVNKFLHVVERTPYNHKTEIYGYLYNNSILDSLATPGNKIDKGVVLRKSIGFDDYNNKANGINALTTYISLDNDMEDSVIISDKFAEKCSATFIEKIKMVVNENDIPINHYGDINNYKTFPNIGEEIKDGIICAFRRKDKDNAIYSQSMYRLQEIMMSDSKLYKDKGTIIDIDIYCNNPELLGSLEYNNQYYKYYLYRQKMCRDIVQLVSYYISLNYKLSYELATLYNRSKEELAGMKFMDKHKFSHMTIEFTVMESLPLNVGDKVSDRFGGKGVVSKIFPENMMPRDSNGVYAEVIKNSQTMYGRENPGQIFELSVNYISSCILNHIRKNTKDVDTALKYITDFLDIVSPVESEEFIKYIEEFPTNKEMFLNSMLEFDCIHVMNRPMSDDMNIDILDKLYNTFPFISREKAIVPIVDSNGNIRYVESRRKLIIANQYLYRLKQVAEDKFSATSLSSTNIKSENAKSKDNKNHKRLYSNTPIRFGNMETTDQGHMGFDIVNFNMMLYSLSPTARLLVEELYTGDPYDIDIKLNTKAKNRSAEIVNARLKTMGYKIEFVKVRKNKKPVIVFDLLEFDTPEDSDVLEFFGENISDKELEEKIKLQANIEDNRKKLSVEFPLLEFMLKSDLLDKENDNG